MRAPSQHSTESASRPPGKSCRRERRHAAGKRHIAGRLRAAARRPAARRCPPSPPISPDARRRHSGRTAPCSSPHVQAAQPLEVSYRDGAAAENQRAHYPPGRVLTGDGLGAYQRPPGPPDCVFMKPVLRIGELLRPMRRGRYLVHVESVPSVVSSINKPPEALVVPRAVLICGAEAHIRRPATGSGRSAGLRSGPRARSAGRQP